MLQAASRLTGKNVAMVRLLRHESIIEEAKVAGEVDIREGAAEIATAVECKLL